MINDVLVNGYKSLMLSAPIKTGNLNVLVGANASGKSSLLQALLLLRQSADKTGDISSLHLSGPLYEGGTVLDVLHPASERKIHVVLTHTEGTTDLTFSHDRERETATSKRLVSAEKTQKIPSMLSDRTNGFAYLNAERIGPRVSYPLPPDDYHLGGLVGKYGEYTAAVLARSKNGTSIQNWEVKVFDSLSSGPKKLDGLDIGAELRDSAGRLDLVCSEMLNWIIPGARFDVEESDQSDTASLRFFRNWETTRTSVRATHIGFGLAYTLPIIVACLSLREDGIIIIENPEAHLQPFSQSRIGAFLACIANTGRQVFVETHSDHVINGMRLAVREEIIPSSQVAINFFSHSGDEDRSSVEQIHPKPNGRLDKWPAGFFDQIENDLSRL